MQLMTSVRNQILSGSSTSSASYTTHRLAQGRPVYAPSARITDTHPVNTRSVHDTPSFLLAFPVISSTHFVLTYHYFGWLMLTTFSFYFNLTLLHLVQFRIHLVVPFYTWFSLFYFALPSLYTFSSCSSHTIDTFFLSSCTQNLAHRASCTENSRAHAQFGKCV